MPWTLLPCDESAAPVATAAATTLDAALDAVAAHLRMSRHASKERVNLDALADHRGKTEYENALQIPDEVFAGLRGQLGLVPFVLCAGADVMVLVADFHGALKGLPPNARANSLCDACGLEYKVRGDVFIGQLHMGGLGLQLGDAPPQVAMDPAWMEAVADANRAGMGRKPGRKITDILSPHLRSAVLRASEAGPAVADAAPNPLLEPSAQARAAAMVSAAAAARVPVAAGPVSSAQSAPTSAAGTTTTGGPAASAPAAGGAPDMDAVRKQRLARFG